MAQTQITTESVTLNVSDGTSMPAYVARPATGGANPGLIVLQEAFGVNAHIKDVTRRLAAQGFTAIAPALFHRTDASFEGSYTDFSAVMPHMQAVTVDGLVADANAAYGWLTSPDGGKAKKVAAIGYCMGGRASFLAATCNPLSAAVSYYGGGIAPGLLDRTPKVSAPILLFWGGLDKHIGSDQVRAVEDSLIAAEKNYVQVIISKADHGFFCDERASYSKEASGLAWALTLEFLDTHLKDGA